MPSSRPWPPPFREPIDECENGESSLTPYERYRQRRMLDPAFRKFYEETMRSIADELTSEGQRIGLEY